MTRARHRTASDQVAPALLNAAETVLDRDGRSGVTIRAVASEAGVAPMSVYNRFGNRDGLLIELATRAFAELAASLNTSTGRTAEARFRRMCRNYRAFALDHPERYALIFSVGSPLKLPASEEASDRGNEAFGHLVDAVEALTLADRSAHKHSSATEAAQSVWNALHGAVTIEHANIGRTDNADKTYEKMIDLLLRGLRRAE